MLSTVSPVAPAGARSWVGPGVVEGVVAGVVGEFVVGFGELVVVVPEEL
jgi:hypothetical protein